MLGKFKSFFKDEQTNTNKKQHTKTSQNKITWEPPLPLQSELEPVVPFDPELLPAPLRNIVMNAARRMDNSAPDYAAISTLICAAALIGGNAGITPKRNDIGWIIYLTLWGIAIGNPSSKKTPLLAVGLKLLQKAQTEYINFKNIQNLEMQTLMLERYELEVEELRAQAKDAFEQGDEEAAKTAIEKIAQKENIVVGPRDVIINDATVEALAIRLKSNPDGVLMYRDELHGWFAGLNKVGREQERAFFLEGFDASKTPYTQERVGRENLVLNSITLSILGGIQPKKLRPILTSRDSGTDDDGLLERFQLAVFPNNSDMKYIDEAPNKKAVETAEAVFLKLAELGEKESMIFTFNDEAQTLWDKWASDMTLKLKNLESDWQSVFGKYPALLAKLALLFHLIEEAENCKETEFNPDLKIEIKHLEMGIKWIDYLSSHSNRIVNFGRKQSNNQNSNVLLKNLHKFGETFTKHHLSQRGWEGLKTASQRDSALLELETAGYIKSIANPKRYLIHPDYRTQQ